MRFRFSHTRSAPSQSRTGDFPLRRRLLFLLRYESLVIVAGLEPASSWQEASLETRFPNVAHRSTRREFHPTGTFRCIRNHYLATLGVAALSVQEPD